MNELDDRLSDILATSYLFGLLVDSLIDLLKSDTNDDTIVFRD